MEAGSAKSVPRFIGLSSSSPRASAATRAASRKSGNRCELLLRRVLWRRGLRYRLGSSGLPGRPDLIFAKHRVAVFCDGDFWHGRDLDRRLSRLAAGHNASYWTAKIARNAARDLDNTRALQRLGWTVVRIWESDIVASPETAADQVSSAVRDASEGASGARRTSNPSAIDVGSHQPSIEAGISPKVIFSTS
jgi:DNA mismatch endonuclease, patch repair protein